MVVVVVMVVGSWGGWGGGGMYPSAAHTQSQLRVLLPGKPTQSFCKPGPSSPVHLSMYNAKIYLERE